MGGSGRGRQPSVPQHDLVLVVLLGLAADSFLIPAVAWPGLVSLWERPGLLAVMQCAV